MTDDKNTDPTKTGAQGGDGNGANDKNTNANDGGNKEPMIPKSRLDEEVKKRRELEDWKKQQEAQQQEAEKKRLEDEGKYKEIAEKETKLRQEVEQKFQKTAKVNALKLKALQSGTIDADAVVALANLDDVKLSEDGSIDETSVGAIIENMKASKKYLFGEKQVESNANIGANGGAPDGGTNTTPTFKRSQLSDTVFYSKNRDAILQAQREGKIVDDITPKN